MADDETPRYWDPALDEISKAYDPEKTESVVDRLWAQRMAEGLAEVGKNRPQPPDRADESVVYDDEHPETATVLIPVEYEVTVPLELGGVEIAMCLEAWTHFEDHQCEWGEDALMEIGGMVVDELKRKLIRDGILDTSWDPDVD